MSERPLDGCRVLDLGILTAGAAATALLADLGADVIKIESRNYQDPFRVWPTGPMSEALRRHHCPPFFRATNRNKRSLGLDLKHPAGRDVFLRLARGCDIVVENFRRGTLESLRIGYQDLAVANEDIILASLSSQGETGPDATRVSFGSTLEATSGLAWLTGYDGDAPAISGQVLNYADQVVALFGAGMIVTALHRRATCGGTHLEISQRELVSYMVGDAFVACNGDEGGRRGNAQPPHVVQECYAASDGRWVAVTVDDGDVSRLRELVGADSTALAGWIGRHDADSCVTRLRTSGIAAARVLDGAEVLAARRFTPEAMVTLRDGTLVKGFPFQLDRMPLRATDDAHELGADSAAVLTEIGGYSEDEIRALIDGNVVAEP